MTLFIIFISFVITQRFAELLLARRNASKMFSLGAVEYDKSGYKYIVLMHISFFTALILEFVFLKRTINTFSLYLFVIFLIAQFLRYWSISTLGIYWNTRIIVLKESKPIRSGPYKYFKHPNYIAVVTELAVIPLMFSCYFTFVFFSLLNLIVLKRRIKIETTALIKIKLMKFGHTEIFVKDPMLSKDFYIDILDFELVEIQMDKYVWLKSGETLVLLRPSKNNSVRVSEYALSDTGFVIYTDNLAESSEKMKSRGLVFKGTDGSDKCLTFTDPDGNWFQLVDPNDH